MTHLFLTLWVMKSLEQLLVANGSTLVEPLIEQSPGQKKIQITFLEKFRPYCYKPKASIYRLGNEKYKSKVVWKSLHPSWLEQFDLHLYDDQEQLMEVTVWDKDKQTKDDFLGKCVFILQIIFVLFFYDYILFRNNVSDSQ